MAVVAALVIQLQILAINLSGAAAAVVGSTQAAALAGLLLLEVTAALEAQQAPQAPNPQAAAAAQLPVTPGLAAQARSS